MVVVNDNRRGLAYNLQALAMVVEPPAAQAAAVESLRLFEQVGDAWGRRTRVPHYGFWRPVGQEQSRH
jgi:hypothetical protein